MEEKWNVMCKVWGGVTGTRQSLLKENGQVKTFPTRVAAEAEAARLTERMNHPNAKAQFSYCAWEAE